MVGPMIPEEALRPGRAIYQASMRHRLTISTTTRIRNPDTGEYEEVPQVRVSNRPCLLMMGGAHVAEIAAARGVKADGTLRVELGEVVLPGERATVTGLTRGVPWTRVLTVTSGADETNRLFGLATVVDVTLNR